MKQHLAMKQRLARLDRVVGGINQVLCVLAITLVCLDLGFFLMLHLPAKTVASLGGAVPVEER
jgi:hypothetical protein